MGRGLPVASAPCPICPRPKGGGGRGAVVNQLSGQLSTLQGTQLPVSQLPPQPKRS